MKCVCSQQKEIKMKRKIIIFLIFVFVSNVSFAHDVQTDKININQEKNGLTAIIASLFYMRYREHQKEICNLLIKSGASLDIFKGGSITPLVYAIKSSDIDIVKLLLNLFIALVKNLE